MTTLFLFYDPIFLTAGCCKINNFHLQERRLSNPALTQQLTFYVWQVILYLQRNDAPPKNRFPSSPFHYDRPFFSLLSFSDSPLSIHFSSPRECSQSIITNIDSTHEHIAMSRKQKKSQKSRRRERASKIRYISALVAITCVSRSLTS